MYTLGSLMTDIERFLEEHPEQRDLPLKSIFWDESGDYDYRHVSYVDLDNGKGYSYIEICD